MTNVTIRPAQDADAVSIAAIWNHMIRDSLATFTTEQKTQTGIETLIAGPDSFVLVADAEAEIIGFVAVFPFRSGPGYGHSVEHSIVLSPKATGQGVGRALIGAASEAARARGKHVLVAAVSSANPQGVAFHGAMGFETVGHMREVGRKNDQWLDLILMQKLL